MHISLLEILRCPQSGQRLSLEDAVERGGEIYSGALRSEDGLCSYPIRGFIPRFVPATNYADNFDMQWNAFRRTQLDSYSGHPISAQRFWKATGWSPQEIAGRWVLDAGCGAGRFAEIALSAGAKVVALDYSGAVDACFANLGPHPNLHVLQGDIYALPLLPAAFDFVYSLGVLQHTPDVARAFAALPRMVRPAGRLCTDVYWKRMRTLLHAKYAVRPITTRMQQQTLFRMLQKSVPALLEASRMLAKVPVAGPFLKRLVPVANYAGVYPLDETQLQEWALLDTFDMLAPCYDSPQSVDTIKRWMADAGLREVEVLHANLLVVRGVKA